MPTDKYNDLKKDKDHKSYISAKLREGKKDSEKTAKPSDLGTGMVRGAADAIRKRKQLLDSI